jgi:hypothetical protein
VSRAVNGAFNMLAHHRQLFLVALGAAIGTAAGPASCTSSGTEPQLADSTISVRFGPGHGGLAALVNLATGKSYLERRAGESSATEGNPFRLVLAPERVPPAAEVTGAPYGDPSFADSPWPDGALGGSFADASEFTLLSASCGGTTVRPSLVLTMALPNQTTCGRLTAVLNVTLAGPGQVEFTLALSSSTSCAVLVAPGWLTGLRLSADPSRTRAVHLFENGQVGGPAWVNAGGYYGEQVAMQWQSVWAAASSDSNTTVTGGGDGLTVWAADDAWQAKLIHRFPVNVSSSSSSGGGGGGGGSAGSGGGGGGGSAGGMGILFVVPVNLLGDQPPLPVGAPFHLVVHGADWRAGAARYAEWFAETFRPRQPPEWLRRVSTNAMGFGSPTPKFVRQYNYTFDEWILGSFAQSSADMAEFTGWWQVDEDRATSSTPMQALDGIYWPPRGDLGGTQALRKAISTAQHEMGRQVCLYVCAAEVANISGAGTIFNSSEGEQVELCPLCPRHHSKLLLPFHNPSSRQTPDAKT